MKTDLVTSIGVAIVGVVLAFLICNLLIPAINDFSFKTISSPVDTELVEPDKEIFNYKSINPTVEVYIGNNCSEFNTEGECAENSKNTTEEEVTREETAEQETP